MYCVGLTANMGSGKSTVLSCFQSLGATVISADEVARELTAKNQPAFLRIQRHFGQSIIHSQTGELNRSRLRKRVFQHPEERCWLEALLHPLINKKIEQTVHSSQGIYAVIEIPLLKNRTDYPFLNRILVVLTDHQTQLERVVARDACTQGEALAILATQSSESVLRQLADDIIINTGSMTALVSATKQLDANYREFSRVLRPN